MVSQTDHNALVGGAALMGEGETGLSQHAWGRGLRGDGHTAPLGTVAGGGGFMRTFINRNLRSILTRGKLNVQCSECTVQYNMY